MNIINSKSPDIPIILQKEVYNTPENRGNIKGYVKLNNYNNIRTAVYKNKKKKIIQIGIRGTSPNSLTDITNDIDLFINNNISKNSSIQKRLNIDLTTYKKLKKQYPNYKLIFSGHSLGASSVSNILDKNPNDKNLEGHLFNHYILPNKNIKKDKRITNNDSGDLLKDPHKTTAAAIGILGQVYQYNSGVMSNVTENQINLIKANPDYQLANLRNIYRQIKFNPEYNMLSRKQNAEYVLKYGEDVRNVESAILKLEPDAPLFQYGLPNAFIEDSLEYEERINELTTATEGLVASGEIASGIGTLAVLYFIGSYIFDKHASSNFKPKNKKLLIKK